MPRFLVVAEELQFAEEAMRACGFGDADVEEELERIRARWWTTPAESPYEREARTAKVRAIVLAIWAGLSDDMRRDPRTGWLLSNAAQPLRDQFAKLAAQHSPSIKAWDEVVDGVCMLVTAERRGAPEPCAGTDAGCHEGEVADGVPCPRCRGTTYEPCANCGLPWPKAVATPLGLYCEPCAKGAR